jgi:hypothetical protein
MARKGKGEQRKHAALIRDRLCNGVFEIPEGLEGHVARFGELQAAYEQAAVATDAARKARAAALAAIGTADAALDESIEGLADAVSAAKLGPRANPFRRYSKHPPSALKALAYAKGTRAVRALVRAIRAVEPPPAVKKAAAACLARCAAVEAAIEAHVGPAAAYAVALAARDALLPGLQKGIKTLKLHAASAWVDAPGRFKAVFAPPSAIEAPKKRRARKAAARKDNGAPAAPSPATPG